jgi:hypothetical protein
MHRRECSPIKITAMHRARTIAGAVQQSSAMEFCMNKLFSDVPSKAAARSAETRARRLQSVLNWNALSGHVRKEQTRQAASIESDALVSRITAWRARR